MSVPILQSWKRYKLCGHKTTLQRYYVATYRVLGTRYAVSTAVGNAMPCHHNIVDTTGTTYTFYEKRNEKKQSKRKQYQGAKKTNRKRRRKTNERKLEEIICRAPFPAREVANTSKITSGKKNTHTTKTPLLVSRVIIQRTK